MKRATALGTLSRKVPVGLSRKAFTASSAPSTSASTGARRSMSRSPASVGVTLRVVRLSRRTPIRASSRRTAVLRAEGDTPRATAAPRKPRARATAMKASRSERLAPVIVQNIAQALPNSQDYRTTDCEACFGHQTRQSGHGA